MKSRRKERGRVGHQHLLDQLSLIEKINAKYRHGRISQLLKMFSRLVPLIQQFHSDLSEKERTQVILRLKTFLTHENSEVIQNVVSSLVQLTDDFTSLSQDVVVALMVQVKLVVQKKEEYCLGLLCEMLCNLVMYHPENQDLFASSGCLDSLLELFTFHLIDSSGNSVECIRHEVNVLVCAACEPTNNINKIQIFNSIAPQVVAFGIEWSENYESAPEIGLIMKECLYLCRRIISSSEECKTIFLQTDCLQMLIQVLSNKNRIEEHVHISLKDIKRNILIDYAPTIFASFVLLLDEALIDCIKVKARALELNAVHVLEYYLDIASDEQLAMVITCLVHLIVDEVDRESRDLTRRMNILAQKHNLNTKGLDTSTQEFLQKPQRRKGTPHPNKSHGVAVKRKCISVPSIETSMQPKEINCKQDLIPMPPSHHPHAPRDMILKALEEGTSTSHQSLITEAELMIFYGCIQIHGNNMMAVRRAFPFHPSLTPADLYALWRAIWR